MMPLPGPPLEVDEDEENPGDAACPICEKRAGDCDHLVASLDLGYAELVAGAIFARQREILELLEQLASSDPDALKVAGAGPALEHVATLIQAEKEEGASAGDAIAIHYPRILAALSHVLQDDGEVTATAIDSESSDQSDLAFLWAEDPEGVVARLVERLEAWAQEVRDP